MTSVSPPIKKYPRTRHIEGSRLQPGDDDNHVPWKQVKGRHLVVEEKVDGANCAVSFDSDGKLLLQSRGHYLVGGAREKHFNALKPWAQSHVTEFRDVLGDRYVMYGEWVYAKHTIFYDALPHYFLEFDVLDRTNGTFLSTPRRKELLQTLPVVSVPVLHESADLRSLEQLVAFVGPSKFKTNDWREHLRQDAEELGIDVMRALEETDSAIEMEGLYLKIEEDGVVQERLKWVRAGFLTTVLDSGTHWLARPIVPNRLAGERAIDVLFQPHANKGGDAW